MPRCTDPRPRSFEKPSVTHNKRMRPLNIPQQSGHPPASLKIFATGGARALGRWPTMARDFPTTDRDTGGGRGLFSMPHRSPQVPKHAPLPRLPSPPRGVEACYTPLKSIRSTGGCGRRRHQYVPPITPPLKNSF